MPYFSRLTDIVTCNLTEILDSAADPLVTVQELINEMQEGLTGAQRSVNTATRNAERFMAEINEHREQVSDWTDKARDALQVSDEETARDALVRKREVEDLISGLEQQHQAALATREHLSTTKRALEARLADALRRQQQIQAGETPTEPEPAGTVDTPSSEPSRHGDIDAELAALKKELGQ